MVLVSEIRNKIRRVPWYPGHLHELAFHGHLPLPIQLLSASTTAIIAVEQVRRFDSLSSSTRASAFPFNSITGLTAIVTSTCTQSEPTMAASVALTDYINPCAILMLYFYFALETTHTFSHRVMRWIRLVFEKRIFSSLLETNKHSGSSVC